MKFVGVNFGSNEFQSSDFSTLNGRSKDQQNRQLK